MTDNVLLKQLGEPHDLPLPVFYPQVDCTHGVQVCKLPLRKKSVLADKVHQCCALPGLNQSSYRSDTSPLAVHATFATLS